MEKPHKENVSGVVSVQMTLLLSIGRNESANVRKKMNTNQGECKYELLFHVLLQQFLSTL